MALPGDKAYLTGVAPGSAVVPAGAVVETISVVTRGSGAGGVGATVAIFGGAAIFVPPGVPFTEPGDQGWIGDGVKAVVFASAVGDILSWIVSFRDF